MSSKDTICKLCFKIAKAGSEEIDVIKMMLNFLLVELQWDLDEYSVICQDCEGVVKMSYSFKSPFIDRINEARFMLNESNENITFPDCMDICQFCSNKVENNKYFPVGNLFREPKFAEMLPAFLPELEFDDARNSLTCIPCGVKLETYCKFISNYLSVKEKVNQYLKESNKEFTVVNLKNIHDFMFKNNETLSHTDMQIKMIKEDVDTSDANKSLEIHFESIKHEDAIDVKEETCTNTHTGENCVYEMGCKNEIEKNLLNHGNKSVEIYKCCICTYQSKLKCDLKVHLLIHQDNSDEKKLKCAHCPYRTMSKELLKSHLRSHRSLSEMKTYKCGSCSFQTKWKGSLGSHKLTHKDISDVKMHKCEVCAYETKYKSHLKTHSQIHKEISDVNPYKCESCPFTTRWRKSLNTHMLTHKKASEVKIYKCDSCTFQTKYRDCLKRHLLTHISFSEAKMHKCYNCTFETKRKYDLEDHMAIHNLPLKKD